ncbi:MAG: flagellar export chaperone FliS [Succinivibrio sp.]|nr:flagellar export chaperone FliS [Succinivibrio sp.]
MYGNKIGAYKKASLTAEISVADPYIVTKMLYQGIFERIAQAKGAISRGDLETKAKKLSSATAILENLKSTLDFSVNESLAQSLYDLYCFIIDKISDASIKLTCEPLDEALRVFMPIKEAWDALPIQAQQEARSKRSAEQIAEQSFKPVLASGRI